jgi:hypothetical protein
VLERFKSVIGDAIGAPDCDLSLMIGTAGAYQKHVVRIMHRDGAPAGYAKLADREGAKRKILAEGAILARIATLPGLQGRIPSVIRLDQLDGFLLLITTPGPDRVAPPTFSDLHIDFLRALHLSTRVEKPLSATAFWRVIRDSLHWLSTRAPGAQFERLGRAWQILDQEFQDRTVVLSTVHRDFAPWNTRLGGGKLFVFDWEDAVAEAPPLHDLLHFFAVQDALSGRRFTLAGSLIDQISERLGLSPSEGRGWDRFILLYLIDMSSYYLRAAVEDPLDGDDTVLRWTERELDDLLRRL